MKRLLSCSAILALVLGAAACKTNPAGRPPVSSPVYQFQPADADDFAEDPEEPDDEPVDDTGVGDAE